MGTKTDLKALSGGVDEQTPSETLGWLRRQLRWESRFAELTAAHADPLGVVVVRSRERSARGAA